MGILLIIYCSEKNRNAWVAKLFLAGNPWNLTARWGGKDVSE